MKTFKRFILSILLILPLTINAAEMININTADKETLMMINGIGEKKAEAIIEYRDANGPFKSIDELENIKGIGKGTIDKQKTVLTVADS